MKGRAACTALLCLRIQVARADVGGVCAAEAQAAVSGYVATDPKQFSSEGCDAVGAERYVLCDVRASEGSCASAPACASNVTISVGCHPRNANTGCCHQHLRKACPTCVPSADWCVDYCTPFSGSSPISSYPPEVHDGFCADIATLTFNSMTRERPEEVSMQGCSVPTAHAHAFCGVEGASGLCSSRPECTGLNTTSLSTCNTSGAIPTCCSVILGKQCIVCETEPVACMQSCNVDVWAEPTAFISEGSPQPAKDDIQEEELASSAPPRPFVRSSTAAIAGGVAAATAFTAALTVCIGFALLRKRGRNIDNGVHVSNPAAEAAPPPTPQLHAPPTPHPQAHVASGPHIVSGDSNNTSYRRHPIWPRQMQPPPSRSGSEPPVDAGGYRCLGRRLPWRWKSPGLLKHDAAVDGADSRRDRHALTQSAVERRPGVHGRRSPGTGGNSTLGWQVGGHASGPDSSFDGITTTVEDERTPYDSAVASREATFAQQKARLIAELDHMRRRDERFLGQYAVLSWTERREGGQGVVQFMRNTRAEIFVAVKFFLSHKAYDTEMQLYKVDVLRSMMPAIRLELRNSDSVERSSRGYPWPPCIVLEKGESLQEWKARTQPAFSTILDALCLITERLAQLHASGWVHRDLKPGNVLRLPRQHSWTLMDFGCAARPGDNVPLTFSPMYAPPEVAEAAESGDRTIVADAAADMWALGVMAFELLTDQPVFHPISATRELIWAQLCGREALPWEDGAVGQREKLKQLHVLKRAVLQCLQRKAHDRPTADKVLLHWRSLFEAATTTTTSSP